MVGAYTEGAVGAKYGLRVLTFESQNRAGMLSEWHRPTDTVANVSEATIEAVEAFVWELVRGLDTPV